MQELKQELRELHQGFVDYYDVAQLSELEEAGDVIEEVEEELTEMLLPGAYERFLVDYMQSQKEEYQDPDGDRDEPLCSCERAFCPIKQANMPSSASLGDDLDAQLMQYRREHNGDCRVLSEARSEFVKRGARVRQGLRQAVGIIRRPPGSNSGDDGDTTPETTV